MKRLRRALLAGWGAAVALLLVAPALAVVPLSFTSKQSFQFPPTGWSLRWYREFFDNPDWITSLTISIELSLVVTGLATVMGTLVALVLNRRFPGKSLLWGVVLAPLVIPSIVAAVGIYAVYITWHLTGTFIGLVLAHTCLAIPFVTVTVASGLASMDRRLSLAAASLGANPWRAFRAVTLPIMLPSVLGGAVLAFATSFDELVISLLLQSPDVRPLPVMMFSSLTFNIDPTVAVASTFTMLITTSVALVIALARRAVR